MNITEQFVVTRPIDSVWVLFTDVSELARCLPGAELTADNGDGTYEGTVSVKLGPIASSFAGKATISFDNDTFTSSIKGRGVDRSGGSQGRVEVDVQLADVDGRQTEVTIDANVMLAGPIAQFGRTGLVNEVSKRLIDEFSACLHAKLDAESVEDASLIKAAEVSGLRLVVVSTWTAFTRWVKGILPGSKS